MKNDISVVAQATPEQLAKINEVRQKFLMDEAKRKMEEGSKRLPPQVLEKGTGLRFNEGKLRYDLVHPFAHEQMVKVLTAGANKYAERNWERGMKWSKVYSSAERHLAAIKAGEDYDPETGLLHAAHLACNAHFLTAYYKIYIQGDDRPKPYLNTLRIGLDIDGVLANWNQHLVGKHTPVYWQCPKIDAAFTEEVKKDYDFWLTIPPLLDPQSLPFEPACYITARTIPAEITQQWLNKNGFPVAPLYSVGEKDSKVNVALKANINLFIDDSYNNFVQLNNAGITTLLYTAPYNVKYNVGHLRINNFTEFKERFLN